MLLIRQREEIALENLRHLVYRLISLIDRRSERLFRGGAMVIQRGLHEADMERTMRYAKSLEEANRETKLALEQQWRRKGFRTFHRMMQERQRLEMSSCFAELKMGSHYYFLTQIQAQSHAMLRECQFRYGYYLSDKVLRKKKAGRFTKKQVLRMIQERHSRAKHVRRALHGMAIKYTFAKHTWYVDCASFGRKVALRIVVGKHLLAATGIVNQRRGRDAMRGRLKEWHRSALLAERGLLVAARGAAQEGALRNRCLEETFATKQREWEARLQALSGESAEKEAAAAQRETALEAKLQNLQAKIRTIRAANLGLQNANPEASAEGAMRPASRTKRFFKP